MGDFAGLAEFSKKLLEDSVMKGDSAILFNSLTDDFKTTLTISELSRRLAQMEHDHGMFTRVDIPPPPIPDPEAEGFWIFDVPMFIGQIEWFARLSINASQKLNNFSFSRKPFYIAPTYFNPHKVKTEELSQLPLIRLNEPTRRKTRKLPICVFIHALVQVNYDGQMGLRYPFRDLDFLAQHKVGLIRNSFENYGEPDTIIAIARQSIEQAVSRPENGGTFIMLHSFAALFLPAILAIKRDAISGVILLNPAWEAAPGSGLENMTVERAQTGLPTLIIGSGNDQILVKDHFDLWQQAIPNAKCQWFEKIDHFLMDAVKIPDEAEYVKTVGHVSEKVLRVIFGWIRPLFKDS
jgi:hypothetical protein